MTRKLHLAHDAF